MKKIIVEVSARHIHLAADDFYYLFGKTAVLEKKEDISQPGQFAAKQTLTIRGAKNSLKNVRILGPFRAKTQVELAISDCRFLGIKAPLRMSGDLKLTPGIILKNGVKKISLKSGVIMAHRHWHLSPDEASHYNVRNNQYISVELEGNRALIFNKIKVKIDKNFRSAIHVDTDEGNAANINKSTVAKLIKI